MSRRDPGAAEGGIPREPGRCACRHLEPLHRIPDGTNKRTGCSASDCSCRQYQPAEAVA